MWWFFFDLKSKYFNHKSFLGQFTWSSTQKKDSRMGNRMWSSKKYSVIVTHIRWFRCRSCYGKERI
jgi:hypothetical protein